MAKNNGSSKLQLDLHTHLIVFNFDKFTYLVAIHLNQRSILDDRLMAKFHLILKKKNNINIWINIYIMNNNNYQLAILVHRLVVLLGF